MVSLDSPEKNRAFAEALEADLVLLSDPGGKNADAYGVRALAGLYSRRWTFYIDREGVIREIDKQVRVDSAGQDVARKLGELGFPKRESGATRPPEPAGGAGSGSSGTSR